MKNYPILIMLFVLFLSYSTMAEVVITNTATQDSLSKLSSQIWKQKTEKDRLEANEVFFKKFQSVLENANSVNFPLDSIVGITRLISANNKLRIFTWNIPLDNGTSKYFGFIQDNNESLQVVPLMSAETEPGDFENAQLLSQLWYGALYYKLIDVKIGELKAYTLIGWDGFTSTSNRKIIDILYRDKSGKIVFGMPVFKTEKGTKCRIVKEYAEKSSMLMRYDYQSILVQKGNKSKKENTWLIVMDRLVPLDPSMKGIQKYYVPSGDTYDGFVFRNGYWVLVEDIEVVNHGFLNK